MKECLNANLLRSAAALGLSLLVISCSSPEEMDEDPLVRPPEEQELAYIPTYSKSVVGGWPKGRSMNPYDVSRVRLGEEVHAYHVGRLPSKDRREMHEAHTVYRVEQDARWDTRLPATPMDSRGVVLGIIEPSRNEVPQDEIINQERQAIAAKLDALRRTMADLEDKSSRLDAQRRKFESAVENVQGVEKKLQALMLEKEQYRLQMEEAKAQVEELKEKERLRIMSGGDSFGPASPKK